MPNLFYKNKHVFDLLFEAVSEGVVVVDKNQQIIATNSSANQMFGYDKVEIEGQSLNILIPRKFHGKHGSYYSEFFQKSSQRKMGQNRSLFGLRKDQSEFPVEIGLNPFEIGHVKFVMAIITDITIRKKAENKIIELNDLLKDKISIRTIELNNTVQDLKEEIEKRIKVEAKLLKALKKEKELNELKTKFLSLVSHEFKTPLSGILNASLLIERYQTAETQDRREKHLLTIKNKVNYLDNILNDFLSVERLDSGKVNYKFSHFKLSKVVNEVVYNANLMLKSGQRINYPKNIDEIDVYQDEKIIELVLSNLLRNAIKYSPENTEIEFKIINSTDGLVFEVKDEGIGIPFKDQKYIFKRYFRAENALTNEGTGIGLNIIKGHLKSLGGTISFLSVENKGTTFIVTLPLIKEK